MNVSVIRGELLRELRHDQKLTLRDVSSRSYIALGYLSEVETGNKQPSDEVLERLTKMLGYSIGEFYWMLSIRMEGTEWSSSSSKLSLV
jgi:transcriptional regulator with XRE-family HTH domain